MEISLLGAEGYYEASELGSKVGYLVVFLLGGLYYEVGPMEGVSLRYSWGPHSCPGGRSPPPPLELSGYISGIITFPLSYESLSSVYVTTTW